MLLSLAVPAAAQTESGQDIRLRLDQQLERQRSDKEARTLEEAEPLDGAPASIVIDGETYSVGNSVDDVGRALYLSITRKQWRDVRRFLASYQKLAGHDPMLILYAQGGLAREAGDLAEAEQHYRALLKIKPDFLPGQLELARVLFENLKDREARSAFDDARTILAGEGDKAEGVRRTVNAYLAALKRRRGWQGNFALGPAYSSNLNQSSGSYTCLLAVPDGSCAIERKVPDPIKATGIGFEGTLGRTVPLSGHHSLRARAIVYGDIYPENHDYSQTTMMARAGYQYQSARNIISLSPSFELGTLASSELYRAWGANAEWQHTAAQNILLRIEANYRDFRYRQPFYGAQDGPLVDVNITGWYVASPSLTIFGGPDFARKDTSDPIDSYGQWGGRMGVNKTFGAGASLLLLTSYRSRKHHAYSELLEGQRRDKQYNVTAIARFPAFQLAGLVPEIIVQHNRVKSNIDWLYSYKRTSASIRLSYAF